MKLVAIESPYAGEIDRNINYLKECALDCLKKGESPYASHAFFTHFLDDNITEQRQLGINAGLAWSSQADYAVFYVDYGMTAGMQAALDYYIKTGKHSEFRHLKNDTEMHANKDAIHSLNFIEEQYMLYEHDNHKIKGMYIHLDKIRQALQTQDEIKCVAGCKHYSGDELKHHKDCPHYTGSLSKMHDDALQTQADLVDLLKSGNHTYLGGEYVFCLKPDEVKKALSRAEGKEVNNG